MKLTLVKSGKFLGTTCDFYRDGNDIFMSRTQLGKALQYKDPANAILRIHERHYERFADKYIEEVGAKLTPTSKFLSEEKTIFMYNEKGIYEICRWSKTKIADEFYDWVYDKIQKLKHNGYYISTEKDEEWLGVREEGKEVRKEETDGIKLFTEYAKAQGSKHYDWYYKHFTNIARKKLNIPDGLERDSMTQKQLRDVMCLESVMGMKIPKMIETGEPYKQVFEDVKQWINEI